MNVQYGRDCDVCVHLDCPDDVLAARLASRAAAATGPSSTESPRDDDRSADAIRRRLEVFHSSTADVIRGYERAGLLCKVRCPSPPAHIKYDTIQSSE